MNDQENKKQIDTEKVIHYWINTSDSNFKTMMNLFKSKDYHWTLFIGHLVIEKLLKAYYVKINNYYPPLIHDLRRLAEKSNLELNKEQILFFDTVTRFNVKARYDDYKLAFYKLCTKKYTKVWIKNIKKYRTWLKEELLKS